jgi:hypothetical protein
MTMSTPAPQQWPVAIADGPALLEAYQQARQQVLLLEQENAALRQEIRWIDQLLAVPASILSPSQKVTLRAAAKAIQSQTADPGKLIQIESWTLCKTVGQSKDTFLENLTYLSEKVGVLRKQTQRIVSEDGHYTTNLYIGATDLTAHPERYRVKTPRNHGGERLLCPHCHSDRLQKKVTITCMGCGAVLDERTNLVNQEETNQPGIPGTVMLQKRQVADPGQAAFFAPPQSHLTTDITRDLDRQVADPEEQGTPDGETPEQEPVSPPVSGPDDHSAQEVPAKRPEPAELMLRAAALLVEIAGPAPEHIEMSTRGPAKYYEVKRPLTLPDARDHLAGKKTKGALLRRPDGMTRALCYDADTSDDWYTLREAAHFLANAGYTPLMEDSPAGRGGHLWIIYSDLVDARAAHRHVCEVAPQLQAIKERWPGSGQHKVRLPGGLYVRPGFSQQCKLYDWMGGRLSATRRDAARVLLTSQTPAAIVPDYPPDPEPGRCSTTSQLPGDAPSRSQLSNSDRVVSTGPCSAYTRGESAGRLRTAYARISPRSSVRWDWGQRRDTTCHKYQRWNRTADLPVAAERIAK